MSHPFLVGLILGFLIGVAGTLIVLLFPVGPSLHGPPGPVPRCKPRPK